MLHWLRLSAFVSAIKLHWRQSLAQSIVFKWILQCIQTALMSIDSPLIESIASIKRQHTGKRAWCLLRDVQSWQGSAVPHWTSRKWDESSLESQGYPLLRNALATPHPKRRRPIDDTKEEEKQERRKNRVEKRLKLKQLRLFDLALTDLNLNAA